jgi:hypothetical protein
MEKQISDLELTKNVSEVMVLPMEMALSTSEMKSASHAANSATVFALQAGSAGRLQLKVEVARQSAEITGANFQRSSGQGMNATRIHQRAFDDRSFLSADLGVIGAVLTAAGTIPGLRDYPGPLSVLYSWAVAVMVEVCH